MENRKVTLTYNDGKDSIDFPVLSGTLGPDVADIRSFGKTGMFTFDPGFLATSACESKITFIDGDLGQRPARSRSDHPAHAARGPDRRPRAACDGGGAAHQ